MNETSFGDPLGADYLGETRKCWNFVVVSFKVLPLQPVTGFRSHKNTLIFWLTQTKPNQKQAAWLPGSPSTATTALTVQQQPKGEVKVRKRLGGVSARRSTRGPTAAAPAQTPRRVREQDRGETRRKSEARAHIDMHSSLLVKNKLCWSTFTKTSILFKIKTRNWAVWYLRGRVG